MSTSTNNFINVPKPNSEIGGEKIDVKYSLLVNDDYVYIQYGSAGAKVARAANTGYNHGWTACRDTVDGHFPTSTSTNNYIEVPKPSASVGETEYIKVKYSLLVEDDYVYIRYGTGGAKVAREANTGYNHGWTACYDTVNGHFPTSTSTNNYIEVPKPSASVGETEYIKVKYSLLVEDGYVYIRYGTGGAKVAREANTPYTNLTPDKLLATAIGTNDADTGAGTKSKTVTMHNPNGKTKGTTIYYGRTTYTTSGGESHYCVNISTEDGTRFARLDVNDLYTSGYSSGRSSGWTACYNSVNGKFPTAAVSGNKLAVPKPKATLDSTTYDPINYYLDATSDNNKAFIRYNNATTGTAIVTVNHGKYNNGWKACYDSVDGKFPTTAATNAYIDVPKPKSSVSDTYSKIRYYILINNGYAYITYNSTSGAKVARETIPYKPTALGQSVKDNGSISSWTKKGSGTDTFYCNGSSGSRSIRIYTYPTITIDGKSINFSDSSINLSDYITGSPTAVYNFGYSEGRSSVQYKPTALGQYVKDVGAITNWTKKGSGGSAFYYSGSEGSRSIRIYSYPVITIDGVSRNLNDYNLSDFITSSPNAVYAFGYSEGFNYNGTNHHDMKIYKDNYSKPQSGTNVIPRGETWTLYPGFKKSTSSSISSDADIVWGGAVSFTAQKGTLVKMTCTAKTQVAPGSNVYNYTFTAQASSFMNKNDEKNFYYF